MDKGFGYMGIETIIVKTNNKCIIIFKTNKLCGMFPAYSVEKDMRGFEFLQRILTHRNKADPAPAPAPAPAEEAKGLFGYSVSEIEAARTVIESSSLQLKDQTTWNESAEAGKKSFGGSDIILCAENWGKLMQYQIETKGQSVAEAAKSTEFLMDAAYPRNAISGFMRGYVTGLLARTWVHGDEFLAWHNSKMPSNLQMTVEPKSESNPTVRVVTGPKIKTA